MNFSHLHRRIGTMLGGLGVGAWFFYDVIHHGGLNSHPRLKHPPPPPIPPPALPCEKYLDDSSSLPSLEPCEKETALIVKTMNELKYFDKDGNLHRDPAHGPAVMKWNKDNDIYLCEYYVHGKLSRDPKSGPAKVLTKNLRGDDEKMYSIRCDTCKFRFTYPKYTTICTICGNSLKIGNESDFYGPMIGYVKDIRYVLDDVPTRDSQDGPAIYHDHMYLDKYGNKYVETEVQYLENGILTRDSQVGPAWSKIKRNNHKDIINIKQYVEHGVLTRDPKVGPASIDLVKDECKFVTSRP
jgi:hypothetical protein